MKHLKALFLAVLVISMTGCYTRLAVRDYEFPKRQTPEDEQIYDESVAEPDSDEYYENDEYYEDDNYNDSYYDNSGVQGDGDVIINVYDYDDYYWYRYRRYYWGYYPGVSIILSSSWYDPYWDWWYWGYYPGSCLVPPYYFYPSFTYYSYWGYYPHYYYNDYYHGKYKYRTNYTGLRNNGGGRGRNPGVRDNFGSRDLVSRNGGSRGGNFEFVNKRTPIEDIVKTKDPRVIKKGGSDNLVQDRSKNVNETVLREKNKQLIDAGNDKGNVSILKGKDQDRTIGRTDDRGKNVAKEKMKDQPKNYLSPKEIEKRNQIKNNNPEKSKNNTNTGKDYTPKEKRTPTKTYKPKKQYSPENRTNTKKNYKPKTNSGNTPKNYTPRTNNGKTNKSYTPRTNSGNTNRSYTPRTNSGNTNKSYTPRTNSGNTNKSYTPRTNSGNSNRSGGTTRGSSNTSRRRG